MPTSQHYVPILKAKQGEIRGLDTVPVGLRGVMTAVLELTRHGYVKPPKGVEQKPPPVRVPLVQHIDATTRAILTKLADGPRVFIDASEMAKDGNEKIEGEYPLTRVVRQLLEEGFRAGPVLSTDLAPAVREEAAALVKSSDGKSACCLRLRDADFSPGTAVASASELMDSLGIRKEWCDLILDFGFVSADKVQATKNTAEAMFKAFGNASGWRSLTAAATGLLTWPSMKEGPLKRIPRTEMKVFEAAQAACSRPVWFGDYGSGGLEHPEVQPEPRAGIKLRYTAQTEILLFSAGQLKGTGGAGFQAICKRLIDMPEFTPGLSWGDDFIADCAEGGPTGGPMEWVQVGTSHHLRFVLRELGFQ